MPAISGITKDAAEQPCQALVRAYRRSDGKFIGEAVSDATTGAYSITTLDTSPHVVYRINASVTDGDPLHQYAALHLHFDGANNSTTFTDVCGNTVTPNGNAKISTAQSVFGGSSGYFDGSSSYLTIPSSTAFDIGSQNMSISMRIKTTQTKENAALVVREWVGSPWTGGWSLLLNGAGGSAMAVYMTGHSTSSVLMQSSTTSYRDGNWHHVEWDKVGNNHTLYIDGVSVASATSSASFASVNKELTIGTDRTFGTAARAYNGYLEELQILVGAARNSSAFTPPTSAYADFARLIGEPTENAQIIDYVTPV